MAELRRHIEGAQTLFARAALAAAVGAGLALAAGFTLNRGIPDTNTSTLAVSTLIALAVGSGFVLGRTRPRTGVDEGTSIEVAALAHDVRAPLVTARSLLQLLQSGALGNLNAEAMDTTGRAATAVGRAQAMLEGALRASTAGAEAPATDLDSALDRALQAVAGGIAQSGAVIERSGDLPTVRADAIALERVLVNLVVNAIVHARPGEPPRIEVDAQQEGRGWLVSVRDHGPGVPDQIRDRAFEPGVRGFSPDGPVGFGLGLATVRRLVEQQGGRAWIDPDTSDGTCVRMLLPAA